MTAPSREKFVKKAALAAFALALAACLSAVFGNARDRDDGALVSASGQWTCSMCPQFILPEPGKCPKCFMDLIPLDEGAGGGTRIELYLKPEAAALAGITAEIAETVETNDGAGEVVAIPASAVLTSLGRSFVFVESVEEEHLVYTMREIERAGTDGVRALVASGLNEGEAVAAEGAFRIDSAMQILGKISLANLPDGDLAEAAEDRLPPYQPAERSGIDVRAGTPGVDAWFGKYEQIRAGLARDEAAATEGPARELAALFADAGRPAEDELNAIITRLAASSRVLAGATELEAKRTAFEKVTEDLVLFARRHGTPAGGLNLVFCPMAFGGGGAYWLQPGDTVDNPYHGLEMPLCGWMVDVIEPYAPAQAIQE